MLLDSVLNIRGSVDLFVEDLVDMTHGDVHSYLIEMDGVSSSAFDGDMKVGREREGRRDRGRPGRRRRRRGYTHTHTRVEEGYS